MAESPVSFAASTAAASWFASVSSAVRVSAGSSIPGGGICLPGAANVLEQIRHPSTSRTKNVRPEERGLENKDRGRGITVPGIYGVSEKRKGLRGRGSLIFRGKVARHITVKIARLTGTPIGRMTSAKRLVSQAAAPQSRIAPIEP